MHAIIRFKGTNAFRMCCDFCAVGDYEDGVKLIASPNGTHICQNCVDICHEIVLDMGIAKHSINADEKPE